MRRVPVVVNGTGSLAARVTAFIGEVRTDLAGFEGFDLEPVAALGPEPSVLVDTVGDVAAMADAVRRGHAVATACLAPLAADPVTFAVLRSDRRLGLSGALLPGLPLAETLTRAVDTGDTVETVLLDGPDARALADEAVAVSALLGVEMRRDRVAVADGESGWWRATVGHRFPRVEQAAVPADGPRTAVVTSRLGEVTLRGPVGGDERTARGLVADVVAFAREGDRPWREHRRRTYRAS